MDRFDIVYTSVLKRAIRTLWIILDGMNLMWIPVIRSWKLNERMYGALQGQNKSETSRRLGEELVLTWRRSFRTSPPSLDLHDERYPGKDPKYGMLSKKETPFAESLYDTYIRVVQYWNNEIVPNIQTGKSVLIVVHGNSLRALIKHLEGISEDEISDLDIPTGIPLIYELNENLQHINHYYLGDPNDVKKAIQKVVDLGKANHQSNRLIIFENRYMISILVPGSEIE